jgi:hypothetical protein
MYLADGSLHVRFTPDGDIYMNDGQLVGRYDDESGNVFKGNETIGLLQRTNPPFRDVLGKNRKPLASVCMNYRDLKKMKDIDGTTIRFFLTSPPSSPSSSTLYFIIIIIIIE